MQEIIVSAAGPSSATQGSGNIALYDINTGSSLVSFKQTSAGVHSTTALETKNGQGGLVLAAQAEKSLLNVYTYQKDQLHLRIVLPEKLTCLATDIWGHFCAGGTQAGRIYIWEMSSGILFNSFEAHYRRISTLKFTPDGAAIISCSEDSGISVWSVPRLLDNTTQNEVATPYCTLSDHTLPVTDIVCGVGRFPNCRVLSSSMDNSCKLWDLSTRSLLATFQFPHPIVAIAMDPTERTFFAASSNGHIHQVNLYKRINDQVGHRTAVVEALGTSGPELIAHEEAAEKQRLIDVGHPITSMVISLTNSLLVVGTTVGLIQIYDIASHQLVRSITANKGFCINDVSVMLKPRDLIGHMSLGDSSKDPMPVLPIAAFQRTRDPKTREVHDVIMMPPAQVSNIGERALEPLWDDLMADHRFFSQGVTSSPVQTGAPGARVTELEAEVARLRADLTKAKGLNNALWESAVGVVMSDKKSGAAAPAGETEPDTGRSKKRRQAA